MEIIVPTIACQGCIDTLVNAIKQLDSTAMVAGDTANKKLTVTSKLSLAEVKTAIANTGHSPA